MSHLKIEMTGPIYQCEQRVIYGDTDAGGVVYNANYLRYFEKGRSGFMREHVMSYRDLEEMGFVLPVVESYVRYKAPARYDDLLVISTSMQPVSGISWRFNHHVRMAENDKLLVKGFTIHASVNRQGKLTKMPAEIIEKMKNFIQTTPFG
jgi:acyl-CoA thioester hydrolase